MAKNSKKICYLCGLDGADSKDHLPPSSLFPSPKPSNLRTLPAHQTCQKQYSNDENKFMQYLSIIGRVDEAYKIFNEKTQRNYLRGYITRGGLPSKDFYELIGKVKPRWVKSSGGIDLGSALTIDIPKPVFDRVLIKIAKGLHYYYRKDRVPDDYEYLVQLISPKYQKEQMSLIKDCNRAGRNGDVFEFVGGFTKQDPNSSVWYMLFYKTLPALVMFLNKDEVKKRKKL